MKFNVEVSPKNDAIFINTDKDLLEYAYSEEVLVSGDAKLAKKLEKIPGVKSVDIATESRYMIFVTKSPNFHCKPIVNKIQAVTRDVVYSNK